MNEENNTFILGPIGAEKHDDPRNIEISFRCSIGVEDPEFGYIVYAIYYRTNTLIDTSHEIIVRGPLNGFFERIQKYSRVVGRVCENKYSAFTDGLSCKENNFNPNAGQIYKIYCKERLNLTAFQRWCQTFVKQLNEEYELPISRQEQKDQIKKLLSCLEYDHQIKVSKNKVFLLRNRDIEVSMILYDSLVEAFGRELVEDAMMEVFGVKTTLIRIADTPTPLKIEDD